MAMTYRGRGIPQIKAARLNDRKAAHIDACLDDSVDMQRDSFASYKLRYNALPEISLADVSTRTEFAGKAIAAPIIISSMTGGAGERFRRINRNLAAAAERLKLPLGLGSMKVLIEHPEAKASFRVRDIAPSVPLIANLGLVSFNYDVHYDDIARILEVVQPDVFALHLNALQEAIQSDGDTDFRGLWRHLEAILRICPLPVYVKECGGGIAPELVARLADSGVAYVDISGSDGTSWAAVEGQVNGGDELGELFKDFGLPTAWVLERLPPAASLAGPNGARIIAGGGIRNGLQAAKALALGADYVSVARPFLIAAERSAAAAIEAGERLIHELRLAMFLVGAASLGQLDGSRLIGGRDGERKQAGSVPGQPR
ncbi:MAG: type 2 isopentenyl-diphosphate Delta-isomerase [Acidobacteriia bacterium]|nr:type 2 isopentenyl-diphosphate Delta-isomerase [Terriglobia bacterium]